MLHFIVEEFGISLELAVTRQRLLAGIVFENILISSPQLASQLRRSGDDIFVGDAKLSISIATVSPVSGLIHFAMNIVNDGTPVKTCALSDFKINSKTIAQQIAAAYINEVKTIKEACTKVHWVK
jgi:hypothetical protein